PEPCAPMLAGLSASTNPRSKVAPTANDRREPQSPCTGQSSVDCAAAVNTCHREPNHAPDYTDAILFPRLLLDGAQRDHWQNLSQEFEERFGSQPQVGVRVPGRVNLIGD